MGPAGALRAAIGAPLPPRDRTLQERDVAAVRAKLGDATFTEAKARGRVMPSEQALAFALETPAPDC